MIRWCAYCQRYQGEIPPLDRYSMTHGACDQCVSEGRLESVDQAFLDQVRGVSRRLFAIVYDGERLDVDEVLEEGQAIGMRPLDLLIGVLQPSLYKIGELWERGEITVEDEHRFSRFARDLIERVSAMLPHALVRAPRPAVLLVRLRGNEHSLGLHLVSLHLAAGGVSSLLMPAGVTPDELSSAVRARRPKVVGVSVSMIDQLDAVRRVRDTLASGAGGRVEPPRLCVGGLPVKRGWEPSREHGFETNPDLREFVAACRGLSAPPG